MRLLIRCDASSALGTGHATRCIALAERAHSSLFLMATGAAFVAERGFASETITGNEELARKVKNWGPGWIVVDLLSDASSAVSALAPIAPVLQIDDAGFAEGTSASLVLNPNVGMKRTDYPSVPSQSLLLGPRYVLLREIFAETKRSSCGQANVFISFGGSDPVNMTGRTIRALSGLGEYRFDVVVGAQNPYVIDIKEAARHRPNIVLHFDPPNIASVMACCDLAVLAGGSMLWESMAVGTPFLAVAIADNQRRNLSWLADNGVGWPMGWHADVGDNAIAAAVRIAMRDPERRQIMAHRGREMIDGMGVSRTLERMKDLMLIASAR